VSLVAATTNRRGIATVRWRLRARSLSLAFGIRHGLRTPCYADRGSVEACAKEDIPPLAAAFGPAEIDKAILDALLRSAA
jgi:hypothetical protein